jgi:hypothetical protein
VGTATESVAGRMTEPLLDFGEFLFRLVVDLGVLQGSDSSLQALRRHLLSGGGFGFRALDTLLGGCPARFDVLDRDALQRLVDGGLDLRLLPARLHRQRLGGLNAHLLLLAADGELDRLDRFVRLLQRGAHGL